MNANVQEEMSMQVDDPTQPQNGHDHAATATAAGGKEPNQVVEPAESEAEYEIEAILSHEEGRFVEGEMAYLVSWIGYGEDDNSWVRAADAEGAQDMITEYWSKQPQVSIKKSGSLPKSKSKKRQSMASTVAIASSSRTTTPKRKSSRSSAAATDMSSVLASSRSKRRTTTGGVGVGIGSGHLIQPDPSRSPSPDQEIDSKIKQIHSDPLLSSTEKNHLEKQHLEQLRIERLRKKYGQIANWDPIIRKIELVEKSDQDKLIMFILFNNGDRLAFENFVCHQRCPLKLIQYYESHIRFKPFQQPQSSIAQAADADAVDANGDDTAQAVDADAEGDDAFVDANDDNDTLTATAAATTTSMVQQEPIPTIQSSEPQQQPIENSIHPLSFDISTQQKQQQQQQQQQQTNDVAMNHFETIPFPSSVGP